MAIQVLGSLCLGVAHQPNKSIQKEIAATDALQLLINFMLNNRNFLIKVCSPFCNTCLLFVPTFFTLLNICLNSL